MQWCVQFDNRGAVVPGTEAAANSPTRKEDSMDFGIKGKRALVLGSSKGLGYAVAHALAEEGATVAVSSSSIERAQAAAAKIAAETGAKTAAFVGDVSNPDNMDKLADDVVAELGGVDILVNNHGGPPLGFAMDLKEEDLTDQFNKMVVSIIRLTGRLVPAMVAQKWGRVLTIGSSGNVEPLPNMVLSNTLRAAIVSYTKTLANEVAKDGVTVNMIAPGTILTDRSRSSTEANAKRRGVSYEEVMAERVKSIPAGRLGDPKEFGAVAAFLASTQASYCTGSIWRVDGGKIKSIV
jgi:3-oxoacyl-[acyl-carrier protein] reductase